MLYELGLMGTLGICAWIALDLGLSTAWRTRITSVVVLAAAAGLWAAGELLLSNATTGAEVIGARRVLFLGVCALGPAWLWTALEARNPGTSRRRRSALLLVALPSAIAYSTLFWDHGGLFLDWTARPSQRGPLFVAHTLYSWSLIGIGLAMLARSPLAAGIPPIERHRGIAAAAVLVCLAANAIYVIGGVPSWDPTPLALGVAAGTIRILVIGQTWGAHYVPFSRNEVVEQMEAGLLVADRGGRVVDCNEAVRRWLKGPIEGRRLADVVQEVSQHEPHALEARGFWLRQQGQVVGAAAVISDRTDARRAERNAEMASRLEALGHLASGVAHEVNNPLTYLSSNLAMLEPWVQHNAQAATTEPVPDDLHFVKRDAESMISDAREGAERIRRIVDQLTSFAQRPATPHEASPVDVATPLQKAVAMAAFGRKDHEIRVREERDVPEVEAEPDEIVHIVLHLLLNALQVTPEGEPIEVEIEAREGGALVRVLDRGPGITQEQRDHLFDPFYTTDRPGRLGLGLSLCWELARQNGGWVEAGNRSGGGAAFSLWLPGAEEA